MQDVIDEILRNLSPEALQHLKELPDTVGAEKDVETLQMFGKVDSIQASQLKDEVQAQLRHQREEIKVYNKLAKEANLELEFSAQLNKNLVPVSQIKEIESQMEEYKRLLSKNASIPDFGVASIPDLHTDLLEKKRQISILEEKLEKYAGIPPNVNEARDAISTLKEEIQLLLEAAERNLNENVAKFFY